MAVILRVSAGGLALEFAVTNVTDIGTYHEGKRVLRVDAFSRRRHRRKHRAAQQSGLERSRRNQHSHSKAAGRGGVGRRTERLTYIIVRRAQASSWNPCSQEG